MAKGRFGSEIDEQIKVLKMGLPVVESLSGLQESIFSLFRSPQLNSHEKSKNWLNFIKLPPLPLLAHVGPMAVWGSLGCCYVSCKLAFMLRTQPVAYSLLSYRGNVLNTEPETD